MSKVRLFVTKVYDVSTFKACIYMQFHARYMNLCISQPPNFNVSKISKNF